MSLYTNLQFHFQENRPWRLLLLYLYWIVCTLPHCACHETADGASRDAITTVSPSALETVRFNNHISDKSTTGEEEVHSSTREQRHHLRSLYDGSNKESQRPSSVPARKPRPNLLFVVSESTRTDDFPMFNGYPGVTPNIQRFFSRPGSILVDQAHTDYPLCNPSRTSMLLGRSPDSTGIKTNYMDWKDRPGSSQWQSLPRFLKEQGYTTMLGGKVFHPGTDDNKAWSVTFDNRAAIDHSQCKKDRQAQSIALDNKTMLPGFIGCETRSTSLPDLLLASKAVRQLSNHRSRKGNPEPFAMFVGFQLPHFPIRVNERYFIDRSRVDASVPQIEPPRNVLEYKNTYSLFAPKHAVRGNHPDEGVIPDFIKGGTEFSGRGSPAVYRRSLRRLHLSGLKEIDAAFQSIVNALDSLGYSSNTLVVYTADHGFAYGETRLWEKDIPMDIVTRVPLMFRLPWEKRRPLHTGPKFFINTLDIYRTVAGFLGIANRVPARPIVQGRDLSRQLLRKKPRGLGGGPNVAYSQVIRCRVPSHCRGTLQGVDVVGYTARTKAFRYIVYLHARNGYVRNFTRTNIISEELYDHSNDHLTIFNQRGARFVGHEFHNIAARNPRVLLNMFNSVQFRFAKVNGRTGPEGLPQLEENGASDAMHV